MKRSKEKKRVFRSMMEFEKFFLPESFKERTTKKPTDAHALGIILAKESLNAIRR